MDAATPLVIGIGNEHRGDDAAGLLAARELRVLLEGNDRVEIAEHRGEGLSLLDLWDGRSTVILVDALHSTGPPGRVIRLDAADRPLEIEAEHGSTHAFGPAGAIELARSLGRLPERIEVYGITGSAFSMGAEVQPAVRDAAHAIARAIVERLGLSGAD
jgi:hydrogenase maturation protease